MAIPISAQIGDPVYFLYKMPTHWDKKNDWVLGEMYKILKGKIITLSRREHLTRQGKIEVTLAHVGVKSDDANIVALEVSMQLIFMTKKEAEHVCYELTMDNLRSLEKRTLLVDYNRWSEKDNPEEERNSDLRRIKRTIKAVKATKPLEFNHPIHVIAAVDDKMGIGKSGGIPWKDKEDLERFKRVTTATKDPNKKNMVIMGRKTFESLRRIPLLERKNVIVTSSRMLRGRGFVDTAYTLHEALLMADESIETIFVIGGERLFSEALKHPNLRHIDLTRIQGDYNCDAFFPVSINQV